MLWVIGCKSVGIVCIIVFNSICGDGGDNVVIILVIFVFVFYWEVCKLS